MTPYLIKEFNTESTEQRREKIAKAIEHYTATGQIDKLVAFCNWCLYKMFDERLLVRECSQCSIHHAKDNFKNALSEL